jgi:cobalt-zinc-cadmium efflux system outer membrane protein
VCPATRAGARRESQAIRIDRRVSAGELTHMSANAVRRRSSTPLPTASTVLTLVLCVTLVMPAAVMAQDQRPAPLSEVQASIPGLRLGLVYGAVAERNPRAAAARSLADAFGARVPAAGLLPDPEVQLGFMNYELPGLRPMGTLGMVQLQVMQMLPLGGKLPLSSRIASHQAAAGRERAADAAWELRARAAAAFYELFAAEQGIEIATGTQRLVQDVSRIAQSMYEVGEGNQADVLRAQVEVARMTEEIARMEAMRSAAAAKLNALMDRPPASVVEHAALPRFPDAAPSIDTITEMALRWRPMIRAGEEDVAAADAMSRRARRELIPDLVVGVQYAQRSGEMGPERMGSLMLGASVPLFAGRRQLKWRDEADAMRAMSVADLAYMKADTRGRVGEVIAMLNRARRLADLYTATVLPQAEAAVTSAVSAYRVGRVDFMTVLDNRMTVNRYRQELVTLRAEEGQAWAELEMLAGRELFDPWSVEIPTSGRGR